jgi:hypothetical protein
MGLFSFLATVVVLASFPGGYWVARRCTKKAGGRVALTLVFGVILLAAGLLAVLICSSASGKIDMK